MKLFTLICLAALAPVALAPRAAAAPITYIESLHGDLPGSGSPLTTFTLDTGLNTVTGAFGGPSGDFDSFAFIIPAGLEVLSLKLVSGQATNLFGTNWDLRSGSANFNGGTSLGSLSIDTPGFAFFAPVPLAPGTYNLSHISFVGTGTADYTFTFDVHQIIPEPSALALLALPALAALSRRRRIQSIH